MLSNAYGPFLLGVFAISQCRHQIKFVTLADKTAVLDHLPWSVKESLLGGAQLPALESASPFSSPLTTTHQVSSVLLGTPTSTILILYLTTSGLSHIPLASSPVCVSPHSNSHQKWIPKINPFLGGTFWLENNMSSLPIRVNSIFWHWEASPYWLHFQLFLCYFLVFLINPSSTLVKGLWSPSWNTSMVSNPHT